MMGFAVAFGNDQVGEDAADGLFARPAEHALGGAVPVEDDALLVDGDDRVVGRLDEQAQRFCDGIGREELVDGHGCDHLKE